MPKRLRQQDIGKIFLLNTEEYLAIDHLLSVTLDLSNLSSNTEAKSAIESASNFQFFCPVRKLMICDSCGRRSSSQSIENLFLRLFPLAVSDMVHLTLISFILLVKIPRVYTLAVLCFTKLMLLSRSPCIGLVASNSRCST